MPNPIIILMKRFTLVHYISLILIVLSFMLQVVYYADTKQLDSPIIMFEFAKTENEIFTLFTQDETALIDVVKGVDHQNWVDFFYLTAYSSLLFVTFNRLRKHENRSLNSTGMILSIMVFIFDICENVVLLKITGALVAGSDFKHYIVSLLVFTNIKWFCLALMFGILSVHYYKIKRIGIVFSVLSILPILLAFPSFFSYCSKYDEYYAYSVMLGFIILIIRIFVSKFAENSYGFYKNYHLKQDFNQ